MSASPQLKAVLGTSGMRWLLDRLSARIGRGEPVGPQAVKTRPNEAEVEAYARVFGSFPAGAALSVDLEALEQILQESGAAASLHEAVIALCGPITNRPEAARANASAWEEAFLALRGDALPVSTGEAAASEAVLREWAEIRRSGLAKRLVNDDPVRGAALLQDAVSLLSRLPADGVSLAELAAQLRGDAHALDVGRPLGTLGLRLARALSGYPGEDRRTCWGLVGVELDPLSTSVLTLNLRLGGNGLASRLAADCAAHGEPCRLTLRQLRREPLVILGERIFACENPAVILTAADRLGSDALPMICAEGEPGSATRMALAAAGSRLRYHGDFDWAGVRIAARVLALSGGASWRFDAASYLRAPKGAELHGAEAETPWDPTLARAMRASGRSVHEEAVMADLMGDLEETG